MAMAQVTDNPAVAEASPVHQQAKQQLHQYFRTYIQPLLRAGKQASWQDILHHVTIRKPWLVQHIGKQQLTYMLRQVFDFND